MVPIVIFTNNDEELAHNTLQLIENTTDLRWNSNNVPTHLREPTLGNITIYNFSWTRGSGLVLTCGDFTRPDDLTPEAVNVQARDFLKGMWLYQEV